MKIAGIVAVLLLGTSTSTMAYQFETDPDWQVRWDNTFRYNGMFRVENQDPKLVQNVFQDDATLSFDKGLVSNRLDLISELDIVWKDTYGFRISGAGWYDSIYNKSNDHPPTSLTWASTSADVGEFTKGVSIIVRQTVMPPSTTMDSPVV